MSSIAKPKRGKATRKDEAEEEAEEEQLEDEYEQDDFVVEVSAERVCSVIECDGSDLLLCLKEVIAKSLSHTHSHTHTYIHTHTHTHSLSHLNIISTHTTQDEEDDIGASRKKKSG